MLSPKNIDSSYRKQFSYNPHYPSFRFFEIGASQVYLTKLILIHNLESTFVCILMNKKIKNLYCNESHYNIQTQVLQIMNQQEYKKFDEIENKTISF